MYHGHNVAMGYAECAADLAKGDEWHGTLHTGDMAKRDSDGYFFIVGRKKRFIKVFGNRVNLDDTERLLSAAFPDADFACIGKDDLLCVYTTLKTEEQHRAISEYLAQTTRLPTKVFHVFLSIQFLKTRQEKRCIRSWIYVKKNFLWIILFGCLD